MTCLDTSHSPRAAGGARIVMATFGSLGDLHPYMAVALEMKARDHNPVIATSAIYRDRIEAEGIGFAPVRPDLQDFGDEAALMRKVTDPRRGPEFVIRDLILPHLRRSFEDLQKAAIGADLLVGHVLTYGVPLVAEQMRVPWVSVALSPISFFSAYDPPALPPAPGLVWLRVLGPRINGALIRIIQWTIRDWSEPVRRLRAELGLPRTSGDPVFSGQFSPWMTLAMFSRALAGPQPDWPPNTKQTGFAFYDRAPNESGLPDSLCRFLDAGEPPIVFTLGSSAVMDAGRFYEESAEAAMKLGRRAVLLIGREAGNRPARSLPQSIHVAEYVPYSILLPRAAATVHQGGIGTTGQALRAGRPMLVMPFSQDQPDNAARVERLGVARVIRRNRYTAARAARELAPLLSDTQYVRRAEEVAVAVRGEQGARAAADSLEELLASPRLSVS